MKVKEKNPNGFLYERLASEIAELIANGTFRPGQRITSVREMSRRKNVSLSTVLEAYRLLENRGSIEVRPQSGYYVAVCGAGGLAEPAQAEMNEPSPVAVENLMMKVLRATLDPDIIQFGCAIPNPALLPTARLGRILARCTKRDDVRQNIIGGPEGCEDLRVQIARHLLAADTRVAPEELIITAGCMEAVSLALRAICKPGETVAVESPGYFGVLHALESQGLKALEIPVHPVTGISLDALGFAVEHQKIAACILMTNFSNPLGCLMPDENKRTLVELLAAKKIPLIEDDIHGELGYSGQRPNTAKSFDREGLVLLCSSFSKDLSPSYRIGWISPGKFFPEVERLKMATNISTAILPQLAIAEFLAGGGYAHHLRKIRRAYAEKTAQMSQAVLKRFPDGSAISSPQGGFLLWVRLPESVDSLELYRLALKSGISLVPGQLFSTGDKFRNYIRLNAAYWSENTADAVRRLGELAGNLAGGIR